MGAWGMSLKSFFLPSSHLSLKREVVWALQKNVTTSFLHFLVVIAVFKPRRRIYLQVPLTTFFFLNDEERENSI